MYSYEDHIRAVKLYLKLGKRTGATLRQLGYPTKNVLKSWYLDTISVCNVSQSAPAQIPAANTQANLPGQDVELACPKCSASSFAAGDSERSS